MSKSSNNFLLKLFIGDRILWSCTVVLCLFSILVSYSATSQFVNRTGNSLSEVVGHTLFIVIGFLMAILIHHRLSKRWLKRLSAIIFGVAAVMLLMITFPSYIPTISFGGFTLFGPGTVNSATRWVIICGAMLQPSELAKLGLMGMLSYLLTSVSDVRIQKFSDWLAKVFNRESIDAVAVKWWMSVIMILFVCVLITLSNMSTGLLIMSISVCMLLLSKLKDNWTVKFIVAMFVLGAIGVGTITVGHETGKQIFSRGETWYNRIVEFVPSSDEEKYEYNDKTAQIIHSQIAISRGGLTGIGVGKSIERDYLPQIYADFVYAIIEEEYGFFIGLLVVFLYSVIMYRCGMIARRARDPYVSLFAIGLGMVIVFQALINMGVAVHIGPVTGQPLPLLSRGRMSMIITLVSIGIIERLAVMSNENPISEADEDEAELQDRMEMEENIRRKEQARIREQEMLQIMEKEKESVGDKILSEEVIASVDESEAGMDIEVATETNDEKLDITVEDRHSFFTDGKE